MDKKLVALLVAVGLASVILYSLDAKPSRLTEFEKFKADYGKVYLDESEEQYRTQVFMKNVMLIEAHNADKTQTYQKGVNQFADLTNEEFIQTYLQTKVPEKKVVNFRTSKPSDVNVGDIDWVAAGMVTPIKNQAQCGSCWAFSATAAHESALLQSGQTVSLSEQQLVDCSRSYGNQGCNGGWMDSAFQYVKDKGLTTTSAYPYVARDQACKIDSGAYKATGFVDVPGCDNLLNALASRPVSVAVDASVWSAYRSGVLSNCGTAVNHGVLLVGASDAYWKIKNSWGTSWGESGFIRIGRGNTCAVCSYPSYPTI